MTNVVGHRAQLGVIIPSTNSVVEDDYSLMRPAGVTFHYGRMYIAEPEAGDDDAFEGLIHQIRASLPTAVRDVLTVKPDHLVMGMSAETFWGGKSGNEAFVARVRELSGLDVSTGADACGRACEVLGLRRIAVVTPYQEVGDAQVRTFALRDDAFPARERAALRAASRMSNVDPSDEVDEETTRELLTLFDPAELAELLVVVGVLTGMARMLAATGFAARSCPVPPAGGQVR